MHFVLWSEAEIPQNVDKSWKLVHLFHEMECDRDSTSLKVHFGGCFVGIKTPIPLLNGLFSKALTARFCVGVTCTNALAF